MFYGKNYKIWGGTRSDQNEPFPYRLSGPLYYIETLSKLI